MPEKILDQFFVDAVEGAELFYGNEFVGGLVQEEPDLLQEFPRCAGAAAGNVFNVFRVDDNA